MSYFKDKVVWITGASSGIGFSLAQELYQRGAKLAVSGRNQAALEALVDGMEPIRVFIKAFDLTEKIENNAAVDEIIQHFGELDVAILNAGISESVELYQFADSFDKTFKVNLLGAVYGIDPVLKYFLKKNAGHIVGIASLASFGALPGAESYCASKSALRILLQGLTASLSKKKIAVSTVCPGFVKTPLTDKNTYKMPFLMSPEKSSRIIADKLEKQKKLICYPWQMACLIRFLHILPNSLYLKIIKHVR